MSSIHNRIVTTFSASAGNAIAVMNQIAGGAMNMGRQWEHSGRQIGVVESQMRALGTTIRYAFAGAAVFAIPTMLSNLKQVQNQLGLMAAIGTQPGGIAYTGQAVRQLGFDAQAGAVAALTPIQDFNNAVVNFLSTVQDVPRDQVTPIVTQIARAAQLAQVSAEDATRSFTTMNVAFGRQSNLANIQKIAAQFFTLTREAPGGIAAGPQVIQQLGQLAQVTRAARGNPGQMFGLLLSTLRAGIPPAQAGRGLQYLIQTLAFPGQGSKESETALASVGIRPGGNIPLTQMLARIFGRAHQLGIRGNLGRVTRLDETTLDELDTSGQGLQQLGIQGRGAVFLGQVFHRIHALRTALAILGQMNTGQAQKDLQEMAGLEQNHLTDIQVLNKGWQRFRDQAKLQEAAVALNTMGLQVAQIFEPALNFVAGKATGLAGAAHRHPGITRDVTLGAAGILGALGVARLGGFRVGGGILGRFTGLLGRGPVMAKAAEDALKGATGPGLSPQNPLYVIVVGQIFGGGGPGPSPTKKDAEQQAVGFLSKWGGRIAGAGGAAFGLRGLGLRAGATAIGTTAAVATGAALFENKFHPVQSLLHEIGIGDAYWLHPKATPRISTEQSARIARLFGSNSPFGAVGIGKTPMLVGRADVNIDLTGQDHHGKKVTKRVHIPVDLWAGGKAPSTRGKQRAGRR
jgi:hypothetical protein